MLFAYRTYQLDHVYAEVTQDIGEGLYHTDFQQHFAAIETALSDA